MELSQYFPYALSRLYKNKDDDIHSSRKERDNKVNKNV